MITKTTVIIAAALAATMALCDGAWAGESWLSSISSAVAVDEDGTVGSPDLGDRERPTFFRLDAEKKELTLLAPDFRRGAVTKLESVRETDGQYVFSGVENGRMTLSIISDGVVWSVFGHALPEERLRVAPRPAATPGR